MNRAGNRSRTRLFTALWAALAALGAWAGPAFADDYQVEIPQSRLALPPQHQMSQPPAPDSLSFGLSSWMPGSFSLPSMIQTTGPFERSGALPSFYGSYNAPVSRLPGLSIKIGGSWSSLTRDGLVGDGSTNGLPVDQTAYLISMRLGAEYAPERLQFRTVQPYGGLSLLPSFAVTGRSEFDEGSVYFGVPLELTLGARMPAKSAGLPWNDVDFDLALDQTVGTVDHSSVAGFGVNGGVRIRL